MKIKQGETLLLYDCGLLFQAQEPQGRTYMVSHIGECHGGSECVAMPVNQKSLFEYRAGRMDLRDLMLVEGREDSYSAKATGNSGELGLELQDIPISKSTDLPMKGFDHDPMFSGHADS